jgi:hypothetical protein
MIYKKCVSLICTVLLSIPVLASADSSPQINCFDQKLTQAQVQENSGLFTPAEIARADTCHKVIVSNKISIDPALQKDFLIGWHEPISFNCSDEGCSSTKFSERVRLTASTTVSDIEFAPNYTESNSSVQIAPIAYAVFDTQYFIPLLTNAFHKAGLSFSLKDTFNNLVLDLYIFQKAEFDVVNSGSQPFLAGISPDVVNGQPDTLLHAYQNQYILYSFDYQKYGAHIHGPRLGNLVESQYVPIEGPGKRLTDADLQISIEHTGHNYAVPQPVVPLTSPLRAVTNYWMYTKKDSKLVLQWQKVEYGVDDGSIKTLTNADTNVSAAMLFGGGIPNVLATSTQNEKPQGFFSWLWNTILSWFR